ncbi:MAG: tRNA 2-selenouridine(34) synthase MnmH [Verrucomicrobiales bacterium]
MPELEIISASDIDLDGSNFSEVIDVRSQSEFAEDHLPGAINLPVLDDAERARIGTIYKQQSPFLARRIGAAIIARRAADYLEGFFAEKPRDYHPLLYCWRGGMRSNSLATILAAVGWRTRLLDGGYKAYRKHLIASFSSHLDSQSFRFVIVGGLTGSGKTRVLTKMADLGHQVIDLEGIAEHRGSALGESMTTDQPSQKRFENLLWESVRRLDSSRPIFLESESSRIGKLQIPAPLWKLMGVAPSIEILIPLELRAAYLLDHYEHFVQDPDLLREKLLKLRHLHGSEQLDDWERQIQAAEWRGFTESILELHYDPAYTRSRKKLFRPQAATIESHDISEAGVEVLARKVAESADSIQGWE